MKQGGSPNERRSDVLECERSAIELTIANAMARNRGRSTSGPFEFGQYVRFELADGHRLAFAR